MPGAWPHPQPRMRMKKHTSVVTAGTPEAIWHSLHDGVTVSFVLGLSCHHPGVMRSIIAS